MRMPTRIVAQHLAFHTQVAFRWMSKFASHMPAPEYKARSITLTAVLMMHGCNMRLFRDYQLHRPVTSAARLGALLAYRPITRTVAGHPAM